MFWTIFLSFFARPLVLWRTWQFLFPSIFADTMTFSLFALNFVSTETMICKKSLCNHLHTFYPLLQPWHNECFCPKIMVFKTSSIFVCLHNLYRFLWIIQLCSGGPWTKISAICEYKASDNWRYLLPIAEIADTTKSAYLEPQTCATNLKKHISF